MLHYIGDQNHLQQAMEACIRISRKTDGRGLKLASELTTLNVCVTNDMPEAGGGGASAKDIPAESPSESDSESGDGDGDPDPERRKRHPYPAPSGTHRNVTATPDALLWSLPTLCERIGLSRSKIYQQIQAGKFPEPLKLGRSSRWLASEIHAWVHTQACARSPKTAG